jgi:hypothetical protein
MSPHRSNLFALLGIGLLASVLGTVVLVAREPATPPPPRGRPLLSRGAHVSAGLQPFAFAARPRKARPRKTGVVSCDRPGGANHVANCKSEGRPAAETWVVSSGRLLYAAAGDYATWNGQVGLGFYWSRDGRTWFDAGPLDFFPHVDPKSGTGDPRVAVGPDGTVYYSFSRFSFTDCSLGGIELARRDPGTGSWQLTQLARNSNSTLQDRPVLALDARTAYVAWDRFDSCSGEDGPSQIQVALLPTAATKLAPSLRLSAPGSTFSAGPTLAADGQGGFWLAWEEYADASAGTGRIELVHWSRSSGWSTAQTISPPGFRDLPNPLPGFRFATNSTPALAVSGGIPWVAWASADSGPGRVSLWSRGKVAAVDDAGGDQLLPALAPDGRGGVAVAFSLADRRQQSLLRVLFENGRLRTVSTRPSYPNADAFFGGRFIGDYEGLALRGHVAVPIWTDLRGPLLGADAATAMTAG